MSQCDFCGAENPDGADFCANCGESLLQPGANAVDSERVPLPTPRLLAHVQGLVPAEPVISSGQLKPGSEASWQRIEQVLTQWEETQGGGERETQRPEDESPLGLSHSAERSRRSLGTKPSPPPAPRAEPLGLSLGTQPRDEASPPPASLPPPSPPPRPLVSSLPPRWLAPAFFLAILLALLLSDLRSPPASAPPLRPDVETVFQLIEILPPGARVLLAWDYEPTTQGEMQLLARPILQHLQQRQALIADVSLRPFGAGVAADARRLAASMRPPGVAAIRPSIDLGFIPGNAAALQALAIAPARAANLPASDMQALDIAADAGITAFDLIIEFSAEATATREWVEQIAARQPTPLIVAASGAITPALEPYVQSGQIAALLSGYPDALAYESLLGQDGPAGAQVTAQTFTHLLVIAIILLALLRSSFHA